MAEHQINLFPARRDDSTAPTREAVPRIVVIDGHSLAYRSYYAIRELTTSSGRPVNAVFGFVRSLLRILDEEGERDATVVVFDAPAKTFRHERYEDYKAWRAPTPEDFPSQLATIQEVVDLLGVHRTQVAGLEADDVIGTIATTCAAWGYAVEILTSDRDAYQLVSDRIAVRGLDKNDRFGPDEVLEKYGVRVDQWTDYRALTGDSSDNIPGARGIGPVSARELLERYETLDAILADLDRVEPAGYAEKIRASRDDVELSRELSRIVTDADVHVDPGAWARHEMDEDALAELLRELEFGTILADLGLLTHGTGGRGASSGSPSRETVPWSERPRQGAVGWVPHPDGGGVAEVAVADDGHLARTTDRDEIGAFLRSAEHLHACDAKALCVAARRVGAMPTPGDDPLLMAYVLDPANTDAQGVIRRYGAATWTDDAVGRAEATAALLADLPERMEDAPRDLYETLEKPLQAVLVAMEAHGVMVDESVLAAQSADLTEHIEAIHERLRGVAGDASFNPNSRDQVATLLYDTLGLKAGKKTSTGKRSTAVSVLERLADEHEAVRDVLAYRESSKLKGTYLDPLPELIDDATGRIHTTFKQTVVATGRLSSVEPNLQNAPILTDMGRRIRKAFVAPAGATLIVADYSQIELRILAHIAQEPVLLEAFRSGVDIHRRTAAEVHDVALDEVTDDMRRVAKTINFGVLYGMSAHRLGRELDLPYATAEAFIERYFERHPHVRRYIDETIAFCRRNGWVETLLGRRRWIPDIESRNRNAREYAERTAYNMPIQGTAADVMKLAMLRLHDRLGELAAHLTLQVHDELVVEAPEERADEVSQAVREAMEGAFDLDVPLAVDVGTGSNWLDAK